MNSKHSPTEPLVTVKLGNEKLKFLIDTEATYSVLNTYKGELSKQEMPVIGATGKKEVRPFFQPIKCGIGNRVFTHKFLYIPDCPMPLLGRDLLSKLDALIAFEKGDRLISIPEEKALEAQVFL